VGNAHRVRCPLQAIVRRETEIENRLRAVFRWEKKEVAFESAYPVTISLFSSGKLKGHEILSSLVAEGKLFRHGQGKYFF
jgi:hypothetical protein